MKVLFISGDLDGGCEEVESVCKELKCQTWKMAVQEANQALKIESSETGTQKVAKMMGAVIARWLESYNEEMRDGKIVWNPDESVARWSGWAWNLKDKAVDGRDQAPKFPTKQTLQRKGKRKSKDGQEKEDGNSAKSKRGREA